MGMRLASALIALCIIAAEVRGTSVRDQLFDHGWLFHRGDSPNGTSTSGNCTATFCTPSFDDSNWRQLTLPHDWSREDLPPREEDRQYPVISARYGAWKLHAGDDPSYAHVSFDDSNWTNAEGGKDWSTYGKEYCAPNATGWYRQHLPAVPGWMVNATGTALSPAVTLSLGIIAGADTTYLNGVLIGGSKSLAPADYATPRAYKIPAGLLTSGTNALAVRVNVYGGWCAPTPPIPLSTTISAHESTAPGTVSFDETTATSRRLTSSSDLGLLAREKERDGPNGSLSDGCYFYNDTDIDPHTAGIGDAPGKVPADCCTLCAGAVWKAKRCKYFTLSHGELALVPPQS
jgi:hypothetical protein